MSAHEQGFLSEPKEGSQSQGGETRRCLRGGQSTLVLHLLTLGGLPPCERRVGKWQLLVLQTACGDGAGEGSMFSVM